MMLNYWHNYLRVVSGFRATASEKEIGLSASLGTIVKHKHRRHGQ